jgi:phosphoglucosamine mutase
MTVVAVARFILFSGPSDHVVRKIVLKKPRLFGTDGVRGVYGQPPLDEKTLRRLAHALALELKDRRSSPRVLMGGDTRESTPAIGRLFAAELAAQGVGVTWLGVVPTPAVAALVRREGADAGVVLSASHNPWHDNGVKLIDPDGFKWQPAAEARLEARLDQVGDGDVAGGEAELTVAEPLVEAYFDDLLASLGDARLDNLHVVLDTGNGAASALAGRLFTAAGATVRVINDRPDGRNINRGCGSTHPEVVAAAVNEEGCELGFTFDGDADRALLADEKGQVRDGDAILYLWARDLKAKGLLRGERIVATSMSNLGLEVALRREGIGILRCDVGDREVVEALERESLVLGGEQSGHIVNRHLTTTGDGLLTALQIAAIVATDGRPLSEQLAGFARFPQVLKSYRVAKKPALAGLPAVVAAERRVEAELGEEGRLVLRYSGTEPLVRIMIEGPSREKIETLEAELAAVLLAELAS